MLLSVEHISKNYGLRQLLQEADFYLDAGDRTGVIGVNGTGKSTLLRILAGAETPDSGTVSRDPNVQISFLPQNPVMADENTALEQIFAAAPAGFRELREYEARAMLDRLGLPDAEQRVSTLSGGQRKRVALAAALIHPADVLILDEPTNHLDSEMVAWLEDWLRRFKGGLVMVTHDRYFLERVCNHIVELSRGSLYGYEANYSKYLELKAQRAEMAEASERKRQAVLRREHEWILRGARARSTKNKAQIERYYALKEQDAPETDSAVQMAGMASRLGRKTVELRHVTKAYGDKTVIRDFSYGILRRDRIGVVGRNGAGKTTLLELISGALEPDSGTVETGATVRMGYFTQEGRELNPEQKVLDFILEVNREVRTDEGAFSASQMLERFLFTGEMQHSPIGRLSGGEKRRLYLLSILMDAPNILLLDEPTNDLDIETLTILEEYLQTFPGAVIAVSHDRYFLDKTAGQIFAVEPGGTVQVYVGNYADYLAQRPAEIAAPKPKAKEPEKQPPRPAPPQKLRFSFKEQRELETIDDELAALEAQVQACDREMAANTSDFEKLQQLTGQKQALEAQLEEKTERWVYLNDLAERIAAQKGEK